MRKDLPINNDRIKRCRKIADVEPFHEWIRAMREHGPCRKRPVGRKNGRFYA